MPRGQSFYPRGGEEVEWDCECGFHRSGSPRDVVYRAESHVRYSCPLTRKVDKKGIKKLVSDLRKLHFTKNM